MKRTYCLLALLLWCGSTDILAQAEVRTWTSAKGAQVTARFIELQGEMAVLEKEDGKRISIALGSLIQADRDYVANLGSTPGPTSAAPAGTGKSFIKGERPEYRITTRMFPKPAHYFHGGVRGAMEKYYSDMDSIGGEMRKGGFKPEAPLDYDLAVEKVYVYAPDSYDGTTNWGIFVHIDPGDGSTIPEAWKPVMADRKLIFGCAWGCENGKPDMRRIGLALDTVASLSHEYVVNTNRVIVSGLSGGGLMATETGMMYPEVFCGVISHAAQCILPSRQSRGRHFNWMQDGDFQRVAKASIRWAFPTGENDKNYKTILGNAQAWEDMKFDYRIFDIPGMAHDIADGPWLDKIIRWIDGENIVGAEPRFDENHIKFSGHTRPGAP